MRELKNKILISTPEPALIINFLMFDKFSNYKNE